MALRQRLKACLTAIHGFNEACLDDECAFYTSRAPPSGLTRVCTNPVAMLLEWQDALVSLPSTASCTCTEACGKWGQGAASASLQWEELGTVQEWLGCDKVFFLLSVLFQLVMLPHRILRHEASASTHPCPVLLLPFNLIYFPHRGLELTPFCPSIKFLKCPSVFSCGPA